MAEEREKKQKVTTGKVSVKKPKKSLKQRLFKHLVDEDAGTLGDYILDELIIPTVLNTVHDVVCGIADKIFGGGGRRTTGTTRVGKPNGMYTNYTAASSAPSKPKNDRNKFDMKQYSFENRIDAETVLDQITAAIEGPYKRATVADYYDLLGKDSDFTDNYYGWDIYDLKSMRVAFIDGEYVIDLPNPKPMR